MNRTSMISLIAAMSFSIAVLDYSTAAQLAIPVLFAFPLALCAGRRSKRLLWATAGVAVAESVAAGFWGFHRVAGDTHWTFVTNHWAGPVNRGLVLDSLLGLAILFHLWISKSRKEASEVAKAERHRLCLIERNEQLETALAKVKSSARGKRKLPGLSIKQYLALAAELSDLHRTIAVVLDGEWGAVVFLCEGRRDAKTVRRSCLGLRDEPYA